MRWWLLVCLMAAILVGAWFAMNNITSLQLIGGTQDSAPSADLQIVEHDVKHRFVYGNQVTHVEDHSEYVFNITVTNAGNLDGTGMLWADITYPSSTTIGDEEHASNSVMISLAAGETNIYQIVVSVHSAVGIIKLDSTAWIES
jgi:hypothetical protein